MPVSKTTIASAVLVGLVVGMALIGSGCGGGGGGVATSLVGYVYDDSTLNPIAGASAQLAGVTSGLSSAAGAFTITGVPTGTHTLTVYVTGYTTVSVSVVLSSGANNVGVIYLPVAQTPGLGKVSGVVSDTGTAVAGALIVAGGRTAYTKDNGSYAIYNVSPGSVTVTAQSGAKTGRTVVTVTPDGTATANLGLSISPPLPPVI